MLAALACALAPLGAWAQTICTDLGPAKPYNVFVLGNMAGANSDTEGALAVGGSLSLANYSVGARLPRGQLAMAVRGAVSFLNGQIYGIADVGQTFTSNGVQFVNGGSLAPAGTPIPVDFAAAADQLTAFSADLAALPDTAPAQSYYGTVTLRGTDPARNVFTLGSDAINQLIIDAPTGSVVVINLPGQSRSLANFSVALQRSTPVLYNFPSATALTLASINPRGSVLAPRAALNFSNGVIDGQLVVASWSQGTWSTLAQANQNPFTCVPMPAKPVCTLSNSKVESPACAGVVHVPAEGESGELLFEDLWPSNGDLDFNDQVVTYNQQLLLDASGKVSALLATFNVLAIGAKLHNGLYFHLPLPANAAASIVLGDSADGAQVPLIPEAGQHELVLRLTDDTFSLFATNGIFLNTEPGLPTAQGKALSVLLTFSPAVALDLSLAPFDVFIARTTERGHEIHQAQYPGSDKMDATLFGTFDDHSTPDRHFVNGSGLPFALLVPQLIPWTLERVEIDRLYPNISVFGRTAGRLDTDWYISDVQMTEAFTHGLLGSLPPLPILFW